MIQVNFPNIEEPEEFSRIELIIVKISQYESMAVPS